MEEELNLSYLFDILKKWILFIILLIIIGCGAGVIYNYGATPKYESATTLYVEPTVTGTGVDYQGLLTNQKMVKTYSTIVKSRRVVNKVIEKLNLDLTYEDMLDMLTVSNDIDTQIITVKIKDTTSSRAYKIANTFASVLIDDLKREMNITNIKVIDEAILNEEAVEPREKINIVIGGFAGLALGILLSFVFESLDNKIKNHDDVKRYLKIKTLGIIPLNSLETTKKKKTYKNIGKTSIRIIDDPGSAISESIRMIRTNLNFADLKIINVTSTMPSEGKSEFITNLASSFAMLDKKVLLIDCDLRKPKIHTNFGFERGRGLSDILLSKFINFEDVVKSYDRNGVHLDILSAGSLVSNPSELINSNNFLNLLNDLKGKYDLILIDCPPISNLTDGVLVSKLSDGTIYVIESDRIDRELIASSLEELELNKAFVLGAVLTKVNIKKEKSKYGYKYNYYYSNK